MTEVIKAFCRDSDLGLPKTITYGRQVRERYVYRRGRQTSFANHLFIQLAPSPASTVHVTDVTSLHGRKFRKL